MEQMKKDLEQQNFTVVDATEKTESLDVSTSEDVAARKELAEMLGEGVEVDSAPSEIEQVQYPIGYQVVLKSPITVITEAGPSLIEVVTFGEELKAKHIASMPMDMQTWRFSHQLALIGACTGLRSAALMELKAYDVPKLMEVATSFFVSGPLIIS